MKALKVENLSKQYRLGLVGTGTLSHDLNRWWHTIRGKEDPYIKIGDENDRSIIGKSDYTWALKDINFEVGHGEVLGIIGRNGAGKSTLLKLLSKVTSPTVGSIKVKGRIASLLEVGTGFHPELTGRENIYLNGAILGMTKSEIRSKLDEIVAFSGCEKYIDTPTKRYSSGMTVRLGFAVAAHLEPEILIIDEVLAVGDAEFQKKALGKMQDVSNSGRTILFVSHNMAAVKSLCTRALVLKNGKLDMEGNVNSCVSLYLKGDNVAENRKIFHDEILILREKNNHDITITEVSVMGENKAFDAPMLVTDNLLLKIVVFIHQNPERYHITFHMKDDNGQIIFSFSHLLNGIKLKKGENSLTAILPSNFFNTGSFYLNLLIVADQKNVIYHEPDIVSFTLVDTSSPLGAWLGKEPGYLKPTFNWIEN